MLSFVIRVALAAGMAAAPTARAHEPDVPSKTDAGEAETFDDEASDESWDEDDDWGEEGRDYNPARDSPEAIEARRMRAGGIALVVLGAAVGIGAVVMAASDPCFRPAGNSCSAPSRNRAAVTMALPALASIGAGATLIALGTKRGREVAMQATASLPGRYAGLSLRTQF